MSTPPFSRRMVHPRQLREFRADFSTAAAGAETAQQFLGAVRARRRAARTIESTRMAAIEVGRALLRMHTSENYFDRYATWTALCEALRIDRQASYDLMHLAEVTDNLNSAGIILARGLSSRQARVLARLEPTEQAELIAYAQADGDATVAGLERLRQQLRAPIEAEARRPKQQQRGNLQPIRRAIAALRKRVSDLPTAERCTAHIDALEQAVNDAERVAGA